MCYGCYGSRGGKGYVSVSPCPASRFDGSTVQGSTVQQFKVRRFNSSRFKVLSTQTGPPEAFRGSTLLTFEPQRVAPLWRTMLRLCCGSDLNFVPYLPTLLRCCGSRGGIGRYPNLAILPPLPRPTGRGVGWI